MTANRNQRSPSIKWRQSRRVGEGSFGQCIIHGGLSGGGHWDSEGHGESSELLLELVRLWQGNPVKELEIEPGNFWRMDWRWKCTVKI